jgi:putative phosphoribosyl transferase
MQYKYKNRHDAGKQLAEYLTAYRNQDDTIVLALPRGGVPVAYEVAKFLSAPLDVCIVRKLGVPWYEELAMGAIAMDGTIVWNKSVVEQSSLSQTEIDKVVNKEQEEIKRREFKYRGDRHFPDLTNKKIILVDDGIATGATMKVAIEALRKKNPAEIIVAVPVAALDSLKEISSLADTVVCAMQPRNFGAVGEWYEDFTQTSDAEVHELISEVYLDTT